MRDARGHGSDPRNSASGSQRFKTAGLRGMGLAPGATFLPRYGNAKQVVEAMRAQMRTTGPGHRAGLMQGIKNFLGG